MREPNSLSFSFTEILFFVFATLLSGVGGVVKRLSNMQKDSRFSSEEICISFILGGFSGIIIALLMYEGNYGAAFTLAAAGAAGYSGGAIIDSILKVIVLVINKHVNVGNVNSVDLREENKYNINEQCCNNKQYMNTHEELEEYQEKRGRLDE